MSAVAAAGSKSITRCARALFEKQPALCGMLGSRVHASPTPHPEDMIPFRTEAAGIGAERDVNAHEQGCHVGPVPVGALIAALSGQKDLRHPKVFERNVGFDQPPDGARPSSRTGPPFQLTRLGEIQDPLAPAARGVAGAGLHGLCHAAEIPLDLRPLDRKAAKPSRLKLAPHESAVGIVRVAD